MNGRDKASQIERVRKLLDAGEILTSLDVRKWDKPIIDLPARMSDLKRSGYAWDKVKRGRATAYYNPNTVDYGELAAWVAGDAEMAVGA